MSQVKEGLYWLPAGPGVHSQPSDSGEACPIITSRHISQRRAYRPKETRIRRTLGKPQV